MSSAYYNSDQSANGFLDIDDYELELAKSESLKDCSQIAHSDDFTFID